MELLEAIRTRRTVREMKPDPVPPKAIERILDAAVWAPNHKLTEPWRFAVLGPETRLALAKAMLAYRAERLPQPVVPEALEPFRKKIWGRFVDIGAAIAVSCARDGFDDEHRKRDDLFSVGIAIQHMQLAAWAEEIGACWVNGLVTKLPGVDRILGVDERGEMLVGVVSLGYPAAPPELVSRTPASAFTRHLP